MIDELGIEMPYDLSAEQAVLGAILLEPQKLGVVSEKLQGREFRLRKHEMIFRRMVELNDAEEPIDLVTLTNRLMEHGELEDIGGVSYLSELVGSVPTAANVEYYVDIIREKHLLRKTIESSITLARQAAMGGDPQKVIASLQTAAAKLSDMAAPKKEFSPISDVLMRVYEDAETRYANRELNRGVTGIASGYPDLDRMTAGFQRSDLIIVAARPSVGKTAFALNIAQNVGIRTGEPVAIFSLEMGEEQLVQRMICAEANIDASRMRTGYFESEDWAKMTMAIGTLSEAPIHIDDTAGIMVHEIRGKCRRLKEKQGLGLVIIDYLQLISAIRRPGVNRTQEVTEITRSLKLMARELDVPVIALSQLSRGVEQRQDKRPMMSDLRESGSIEQDADIVAFLYRDDYYEKESEKKNIIEIIIAKQRNGPVGTVELAFIKQFNKFVNLDRAHAERSA